MPIYGPSCFPVIISSVSVSRVSWLCSRCVQLVLSIYSLLNPCFLSVVECLPMCSCVSYVCGSLKPLFCRNSSSPRSWLPEECDRTTDPERWTDSPSRRWSSQPVPSPLAGGISPSWSSPENSAGSPRWISIAPYGSPRHHRIVLERGDLPVSGKLPVPSRNQPTSVSAGPAQLIFISAGTIQFIFISAGPAQLTFVFPGYFQFDASRAPPRAHASRAPPRASACSETAPSSACPETAPSSACSETAPSSACSETVPSSACSETAPSSACSETAPSSASSPTAPSSACSPTAPSCGRSSQALSVVPAGPVQLRAARAPPRRCAARAPPRRCAARAPPRCCAARAPPSAFSPALQSPCRPRPAHQSPCRLLSTPLRRVSPRKFWGGATHHGGLPSSPIRHGLPSFLLRHGGIPSSLLRHGRPITLIRHGRRSPRIRHGSRNGHRPGGHLSGLQVLEASRAPTPPPLSMSYGAGRAYWKGGVMSEFVFLCLCFRAHIWSFLFPSHY